MADAVEGAKKAGGSALRFAWTATKIAVPTVVILALTGIAFSPDLAAADGINLVKEGWEVGQEAVTGIADKFTGAAASAPAVVTPDPVTTAAVTQPVITSSTPFAELDWSVNSAPAVDPASAVSSGGNGFIANEPGF